MRFFGSRAPQPGDRVRLQGVPYEGSGNCRPGASSGPQAVRRGSQLIETYVPRLGLDLLDLPVGDLGDLAIEDFSELAAGMARLLEGNWLPVWIGGDHTLTEVACKLMARRYEDLAVVSFDAHLDAYDVYFGGERHAHATWTRRVGEDLGDGRLWCLGARAYTQAEEHYFLHHQRLLPLHEISLVDAARAAVDEVGDRPVYVSIDVDVLDPAYAPGVGNPEGLGATNRELWQALEVFKGVRVVGFDVVEVIPAFDTGDRTAVVAAELVRDFILSWWS